jgi:TP901 family phage tail tape measure protein
MAEGGAFVAGAILSKLLLDTRGWKEGIASVKKDQGEVSTAFTRAAEKVGTFGKILGGAGAAIVGTFGAMIKKSTDYGDTLIKTSERTGIAVEKLSSLKLSADKSDTSLGMLAKSIKFLGIHMIESTQKGSDQAEMFKKLGISATDSSGKLKSADDVLIELADVFKGMPDGVEKTNLAVKMFGKAGMEMIPMLNLGSEGLKADREETERLGLVWSTSAAQSARDFKDRLTELKGSLQGATFSIGKELIPVATGLVTKIKEVVIQIVGWIKTHPELVRTLGEVAIKAGGVMTAVGALLLILPKVIAGFQAIKTVSTLLMGAMTPLGVAIMAVAAAAIYATTLIMQLKAAKEQLKEATKRADAQEAILKEKLVEVAKAAGLNASVIDDLIKKYNGSVAAVAMAIKQGKEGKELQEASAKVGREHGAAIDEQREAYEKAHPKLKDFTMAMINSKEVEEKAIQVKKELAEAVKKIFDEIDPLKAIIKDNIDKQKTLTEAFQAGVISIGQYKTGMKYLEEEIRSFGSSVVNTALPAARNLNDVIGKAPGVMQEVNWTGFADAGKKSAETVSSAWQEVSTIISDMAKKWADALIGLLGISSSLAYKTKEFNDTVFKDMETVANATYDAIKARIDEQLAAVKKANEDERKGIEAKYKAAMTAVSEYYDKLIKEVNEHYDAATTKARQYYDGLMDVARKFYDAERDKAKEYYDALADAEDKAYDAREKKIRRAEEDEDIRYARKYDREREAIQNSTMSDEEKRKALLALEIAYEDAKLARERKREDEKEKREEAHEKKLAQIRERERQRDEQLQIQLQNRLLQLEKQRDARLEQLANQREARTRQLEKQREAREKQLLDQKEARETAAEARREAAEKQLLADLLAAQNAHQTELDNIRKAEDAARKAHADAEEARQKSLWNKIKTTVGNAIEDILKIFATKLFEKNIFKPLSDWASKTMGKEKGGVEDIVSSSCGKIKTTIGGLGTSIGTVFTTLATTIGTALTTLATAIATAATTLAAAAGPLAIVLGIALAAYAGFTLIKSLFEKAPSGGDVTYWLKMIKDNSQCIKDVLFINYWEWITKILAAVEKIRDTVGGTVGKTSSDMWNKLDEIKSVLVEKLHAIGEILRDIRSDIHSLNQKVTFGTRWQTGFEGIVTSPITPLIGEVPEYVKVTPLAGKGGTTGMGIGTNNISVSINIQSWDGEDVERFFRGKGKDMILDLFRRNSGGFTRTTELYSSRYRQ